MNQPLTKSVSNQSRYVSYIEFLHDIGSMGLGCLRTDSENAPNLLGVLALSNQLQYLPLSYAEGILKGIVFCQVCVGNDLGNRGTQVNFAAKNRPNRFHQ